MMQQEKTIVGISIGDLNGIGPEVILKALSQEILDANIVVVYANVSDMEYVAKSLGLSYAFNAVTVIGAAVPGRLNVVNCWDKSFVFELGKPTKDAGRKAIISLERVVQDLKNGHVDILVTAPINKVNIQSDTFNFPGHTNYIASCLKEKALMFMVHDAIKVGLLTDHIPIKDVAKHITKELVLEKASKMYNSLKIDFNIVAPKIAVLGINPHVGDNGVIGADDQEVLIPALKEINAAGQFLYGPFPADSFFGAQEYKNYDAVLASYHDQGLIPFKTLSFGSGVNFTAGLSKVRTSPDHGTAYNIAGKNTANESSFKAAIIRGLKIFKNRRLY
jgi:4-hydroxythreonine-4-phosphate dehydrogenase